MFFYFFTNYVKINSRSRAIFKLIVPLQVLQNLSAVPFTAPSVWIRFMYKLFLSHFCQRNRQRLQIPIRYSSMLHPSHTLHNVSLYIFYKLQEIILKLRLSLLNKWGYSYFLFPIGELSIERSTKENKSASFCKCRWEIVQFRVCVCFMCSTISLL